MIVMAGRQAKPVLPLGSFYPRDCSLMGFAMFNASPAEQDRGAADINRWVSEGKLRPLVGRTFPLADAAQAERFLEENSLHGAGSLTGKVVLTVE
jgi:NADPH2:quinone reductase